MTSPFDWKGKPSMVVNDTHYKAHKGGRSRQQIAQDVVQKVYDKGINHGTVLGVSDKTEAGLSESFNRIHRRKK
jgi:hypothetical protein